MITLQILKQFLSNAGQKSWEAIKTPVGLVVLSSTATGGVTYLLGSTSREIELTRTKQKMDEEISEKNSFRKQVDRQQERIQELTIVLRKVDKEVNDTKFSLEACERKLAFKQSSWLGFWFNSKDSCCECSDNRLNQKKN